MDAAAEQLEALVARWDGVEKRRMFGCDAYLVRGRMFAFLGPMGLVLKPPSSERESLLAKPGVAPFAPRGGAPFGDWLLQWQLPAAAVEQAAEWLRRAYEQAAALPAKAARRRRR